MEFIDEGKARDEIIRVMRIATTQGLPANEMEHLQVIGHRVRGETV